MVRGATSRLAVALGIAVVAHAALLWLLHGRPVVVRPALAIADEAAEPTQVQLGDAPAAAGPSSPAPPGAASSAAASASPPSPASPLVPSPLAPVASAPPPSASSSDGPPSESPASSTPSAAGGGAPAPPGAGAGRPGVAAAGATGAAAHAANPGELLARVRAARRYPELARRREIEGVVRVSFRVDAATGRPVAARVTRPADPLLDAAALEAIDRAAPLPFVDGEVEVDLDFRLDTP